LTVDKTGGSVELGSNIAFPSGHDMDLLSGTVNMNGYNLSIPDRLVMNAGTKIYKECGTLTYNATGSTINGDIFEGNDGVSISIADAEDIIETDASDVDQYFVVSLSAPNCVNTTFTYATNDGTAKAPDDYTAIAPTIGTIAAGQTAMTIT